MKLHAPISLICTLLFAASAASASGLVSVSFTDSSRYADAGSSPWEKEANLGVIERHLQDLGTRHLRDGETLKVEVLDVDLAGTVKPWRVSGNEIRIVRGTSDWPRISLRYTLEAGGKTLGSGTEQLADMNFTRGLVDIRGPQTLQYEKRMLEKWFRSTFVERGAAN